MSANTCKMPEIRGSKSAFQKCKFIESFGKFGDFKNGQNGVEIRGFGDGPKMGPEMDTILDPQKQGFTQIPI